MRKKIGDSAIIIIAGRISGTDALKKSVSRRPRICEMHKGKLYERVARADGEDVYNWILKEKTVKPWKEVWHSLFPGEPKKKVNWKDLALLSDNAQVEYREYRHGVLALQCLVSMGYLREGGLL